MSSKPLHAGNKGVTPDGVIPHTYYDDGLDGSSCNSTPYASAPSSPGRSTPTPAPVGYFYSAPSSPMHFLKTSASTSSSSSLSAAGAASCSNGAAVEFEFGFCGPCIEADVNRSADELFLNGQIRPMKLSSHLKRPQILAPLIDVDDEEEDDEEDQTAEIEVVRGRDFKKMRDRSMRRKARSLSPLRTDWNNLEDDSDHHRDKQDEAEERKICTGAKVGDPSSTSRSSSGGRNSKRWVFLKDFMRSKSDGSNSRSSRQATRFWSSISFSNIKSSASSNQKPVKLQKVKLKEEFSQTVGARATGGDGCRAMNAIGKRRSAHEAHYAAKRCQAEEMRRKTFLPYRQSLLGCLGFSSKGYGAMTGYARALNSVSSR